MPHYFVVGKVNKEGAEIEMEMEIAAVRLQLRVECKSKVYCVWYGVCGCHGEIEREKGGQKENRCTGFLLASRVYNLGLASSIAMAGKRTRGRNVTCSSGPACRPAGRGTAGQGKGSYVGPIGRYLTFDNNSQEDNPKPAPPLF